MTLLFLTLFLFPGTLLSYILFPTTHLMKRLVLSVTGSCVLFSIVNFINSITGTSSFAVGIIEYIILSIIIGAVLYTRTAMVKTERDNDTLFLVLTAVFGTIWKLLFFAPIHHLASAYDYASLFSKDNIPDLGFYTGMAADHANYAPDTVNAFWLLMEHSLLNFNVSLFLTTFVYLGFIYLLATTYTENRHIAWFATLIMMFAPIEIFYTSNHVFGHAMAYLACFSLFLLYKSPKEHIKSYALLAAGLCVTMATIYYTSTVVTVLLCGGFLLGLLIEHSFCVKNFKKLFLSLWRDARVKSFAGILVGTGLIFFIINTHLITFTNNLITNTSSLTQAVKTTLRVQTEAVPDGVPTLRPYMDPNIFGISALRAQALFFLIWGFFFLIRIWKTRKEISRKDTELLYALIPTTIVSLAFFSVSYPARAFDYFAFFPLLLISLSPKAYKPLLALSIVFIFISGLLVMQDKRIFFDRAQSEVEGAAWIAKNIKGLVLSDQVFVNLLVQEGFYSVTGTSDTDPRLTDLFYQHDPEKLIRTASTSLDLDYLVTTNRMREQFILMLDTPQVPILNQDLIDNTFKKVYDNGDVQVYATKPNK